MDNIDKARAVTRAFQIEGEAGDIRVNRQGHINSTFISEFTENGRIRRYTHQMINKSVFSDPARIMENIESVTSHIRKKIANLPDMESRCLEVISARDGKPYATDEDGNYWRTYRYIDEAISYNKVPGIDIAYNLGRGIGLFQKQLSDYNASSLYIPLPHFHDMSMRYSQLDEAVANDTKKRKEVVIDELSFLDENRKRGCIIWNDYEKGLLPERVTHNDTKINNVLFSPETGEALCVIDLDTIMPGTVLFDTGDMIRTACSTADEDEKDASLMDFSVDSYKAITDGYLSLASSFLTEAETAGIKESGRMMAQIMAVRFLTDYLNGDVYYRIDYPEHNLVRARTQIALIKAMDRRWKDF